ncbi:monovalent cation/H+ antiporter complex subunit F [Arthrobacter sp. H20]|uniref:monovalent cation/H+ antiporter complex subunit F n=1 Tax=Arthrobacter sp. H20 TaxID=1267981 RepID=UPI00047C160C|nr:monovalent cation/H+ antiporter complex subunit F [Arthrobacter sp. H20]
MTVAVIVVGLLLGLASLCALYRIARGPSILDRVLAIDVLLATIGGALAVDMAVNRHLDNVVLLVAISVIGFIGSVTVARFVTDRK